MRANTFVFVRHIQNRVSASFLGFFKDIVCLNNEIFTAQTVLHRTPGSLVNKELCRIWSDYERASSLIYGNKMPTRCNRWYLLQILLLAQHVSGNTMPIIRSLRVLYRWSLPVVFGALVFMLSAWCGAEGYVSGLQAAIYKPVWHIPLLSV